MSVKSLDETNLQKTIDGGDIVVVEFYAPWCPHCKRMAPVYEEAAKKIGSKAELCKVDGDAKPELMEMFGAEVYPTIFFFKKGKVKYKTEGEVPMESIVEKVESLV